MTTLDRVRLGVSIVGLLAYFVLMLHANGAQCIEGVRMATNEGLLCGFAFAQVVMFAVLRRGQDSVTLRIFSKGVILMFGHGLYWLYRMVTAGDPNTCSNGDGGVKGLAFVSVIVLGLLICLIPTIRRLVWRLRRQARSPRP